MAEIDRLASKMKVAAFSMHALAHLKGTVSSNRNYHGLLLQCQDQLVSICVQKKVLPDFMLTDCRAMWRDLYQSALGQKHILSARVGDFWLHLNRWRASTMRLTSSALLVPHCRFASQPGHGIILSALT